MPGFKLWLVVAFCGTHANSSAYWAGFIVLSLRSNNRTVPLKEMDEPMVARSIGEISAFANCKDSSQIVVLLPQPCRGKCVAGIAESSPRHQTRLPHRNKRLAYDQIAILRGIGVCSRRNSMTEGQSSISALRRKKPKWPIWVNPISLGSTIARRTRPAG